VGTDQIAILLGRGIMTSEGALWQPSARMLQPAFHRRVIDLFGSLIAGVTAQYAQRWRELVQRGAPVNITEAASELTLDINLRAIFGTTLPSFASASAPIPSPSFTRQQSRPEIRVSHPLACGHRSRAHRPPPLASGGGAFRLFRHGPRRARQGNGETMTEKQLIDEVLTLVVAGHETTATALTWVWYLLGKHPAIQEELAASARELPPDTVLGIDAIEGWTCGQQWSRRACGSVRRDGS